MSKTLSRLAVLAAFHLGLAQLVLADGTDAIIPYKTMDDLCQVASAVDQTKLLVRVFVSSQNKAVHPSDISLTIQSSAKGMIPVQVGTNGQILNFPHEKELSRENPSIIANQPKGTLGLSISTQIVLPEALTFHYERLGDGVAEANKAIKAQAGMLLSLLAPKAQGVVFCFPKASAGKASVVIASSAGKQAFTADEKGRVKLKLEKNLLSENPEVQLSEKPQVVVPDIE